MPKIGFFTHRREGEQHCPIAMQTAAKKLNAETWRTEEGRGGKSWNGSEDPAWFSGFLDFPPRVSAFLDASAWLFYPRDPGQSSLLIQTTFKPAQIKGFLGVLQKIKKGERGKTLADLDSLCVHPHAFLRVFCVSVVNFIFLKQLRVRT